MIKYFFILLLTLLSVGCFEMMAASFEPLLCPDPPSVAGMVPKIKGQPAQLSDRRMSVQGTFAPKAEVIMSEQGTVGGPGKKISPRYRGNCWTTAGLPLDTLTKAVSTALAHAGLVPSPKGGKYMFQFEVERQSLTYTSHEPGLGSCTATVTVSYSVSESDPKAPIWKEEITGEHKIQYGFSAGARNHDSRSTEAAAIEGAVASNLEVLIRKLKDLPFDKD